MAARKLTRMQLMLRGVRNLLNVYGYRLTRPIEIEKIPKKK